MATDAGAGATRIMLGATLALIVAALIGYVALSRSTTPAVPAVAVVDVPQVAPDVAPTPDPVGPRITHVRLEPDGAAVISGFAMGGAPVDILLDGALLMRVATEPDGSFVALTTFAPSTQPRLLSLIADPDGMATPSDDEVILAPQDAIAVVAQAGAAPEPSVEVATTEIVADIDDMPETVALLPAVDTPDPAATPSAPAVLLSEAAGVRVLQPSIAADLPPDVMSSVALDSITYDPAGEVTLAGRAGAAGFVRIYLDNVPLSDAPIAPTGSWSIDLPQVDSGVYTLRVDQVDMAGAVVSRIETPFQREDPADIAAAMADQTQDGFAVAVKTVQPGATLWAIARERYGEGVMYVRVFEANRDRIRDPDLIYPGQVFVIPETTQ